MTEVFKVTKYGRITVMGMAVSRNRSMLSKLVARMLGQTTLTTDGGNQK